MERMCLNFFWLGGKHLGPALATCSPLYPTAHFFVFLFFFGLV